MKVISKEVRVVVEFTEKEIKVLVKYLISKNPSEEFIGTKDGIMIDEIYFALVNVAKKEVEEDES